jgi:hypothetical protein
MKGTGHWKIIVQWASISLMKSVDCWLVEPVRNRSCVRSLCSYRRPVKWGSWISSWCRSRVRHVRDDRWSSRRRNVRSDDRICGLSRDVVGWRSAVLCWRSGESVTNIQNGAELLHNRRYSGLSLLKAGKLSSSFIVAVTSDRVDDKQGSDHSVSKQMISTFNKNHELYKLTEGGSWCRLQLMVFVVVNPAEECLTAGCTGHLLWRDGGSITKSSHAQVNENSVIGWEVIPIN